MFSCLQAAGNSAEKEVGVVSTPEISIKALIRRGKLPKIVDNPRVFGPEKLQTYVAVMRKDGITTKSVEGQIVATGPSKTRKTVEEEACELLRKISKERGYKLP